MAEIISPAPAQRGNGKSLSYWLGTKICNQPLAMEIEAAARLQNAISERSFDRQLNVDVSASRFAGSEDYRSGYSVTKDGIALVRVSGILLDRGSWLGDLYGLATTYEGLAEQFRRLAKDDAIKAVVLDIDSGGGMVAGLFDLIKPLATLKAKKKVYGLAANFAASAAYAVGCAADEFYLTSQAMVGSIGVIQLHASFAKMLEGAGVETTIIHAGQHKPNGNPYQSLTHLARGEMTDIVDQAYEAFVDHVAKHRPLDEAAVKATEARVYIGQKAVEAKLADGVKSFEELLTHIRKGFSARGGSSKRGGRMSTTEGTPAAAERPDYDAAIAASLATIAASNAKADAPKSAAAESPAPAASEAPAAGPEDASARIWAILESEEAKTRPGLARHIAKSTSLSVDQAIATLAAAPAEKAEQTGAGAALSAALEQRMASPENSGGVAPEASTEKPKRKPFSQIAAETA